MESSISLKFDSQYKIFGFYQLFGGLIGLYLVFSSIYNLGFQSIPVIFLFIVMFLFYIYSTICGVLCLRKNEMALTLSYINQLLQIIGIGFAGYLYNYAAGIYFSLSFDLKNFSNFNFLNGISKMNLQFNTSSNSVMFEINLIAISLMIWIDKLKTKIKNEVLNLKTEEFGNS